jgi:uncharacterized protein YcfL
MKKMMLTGVAVVGLLFVGCQDTVNTVGNRESSMQREKVDTSRVSTDSFINRRLKIERVDKKIKPDGLMLVQVTAKNVRTGFFSEIGSWFMGDNPYKITYRFSWLDKDGMEVRTAASTWIPMTVIPGDTIRIQAMSPNSRCRDFILSLRENSE